jgi:hypothetical protein
VLGQDTGEIAGGFLGAVDGRVIAVAQIHHEQRDDQNDEAGAERRDRASRATVQFLRNEPHSVYSMALSMKFRACPTAGTDACRRSAHRFELAEHFGGSGIGVRGTQLLSCVLPKKQKNAIKFDT